MKNIICLLFLICFFSCKNQPKTDQAADQTESKDTAILEKTFIELGGEKQYVEITGQSASNPILLFLHGGPGWPQTPHLRYFNAALTKSMTIVAWEQSGCGQSYMQNPNPKNLSLEQIVKDAHELTQLLKKRFKQQKIYLVGFSWGSMPGLQLIQQYPEDYRAYFGITQVLDINKSIAVSREWIKKQAALKNDQASLKILSRLEKGDTSLCIHPMDCFLKQYEILSKYGGAIYTKASEAEILKAETQTYEDYKNYDWYTAFKYSAYRLEKDVFNTDLSKIRELKIPVYFFMGRHDWNLPTSVTETFVKNLTAPKKEIVWFENSGHEPLEEEAGAFNKAMIERVIK